MQFWQYTMLNNIEIREQKRERKRKREITYKKILICKQEDINLKINRNSLIIHETNTKYIIGGRSPKNAYKFF